tara:strand:+ start:50 stop:163 length:114 start_codon:yes stop_codon:yes gene_type:complete
MTHEEKSAVYVLAGLLAIVLVLAPLLVAFSQVMRAFQ